MDFGWIQQTVIAFGAGNTAQGSMEGSEFAGLCGMHKTNMLSKEGMK